MKKKVGYILDISIVIIMVIAVIILAFRIKSLQNDKQLLTVELATMKDSVLTFRTENGLLISKIKSVEVDKRNLKESLSIAGFEKERLKSENIRLRNVVQAMEIELQASSSGSIVLKDTIIISQKDTVNYSVFDWNNGIMYLNGKIHGSDLDFWYKYNARIKLIEERRKKETIITATINDENATIVSGRSITVSQKRKWYERPVTWGIAGFVAGAVLAK